VTFLANFELMCMILIFDCHWFQEYVVVNPIIPRLVDVLRSDVDGQLKNKHAPNVAKLTWSTISSTAEYISRVKKRV
jgi:hypothetical protein